DSGGGGGPQDPGGGNGVGGGVGPGRAGVRYHHPFARPLRLGLRPPPPGPLARLHETAATGFAAHGDPVEAVADAPAAPDRGPAGRVLADHWPALYLDGQAAVIHELLGRFPAEASAADAELAAVAAGDELARGSLEAAEWHLAQAERGSELVTEG